MLIVKNTFLEYPTTCCVQPRRISVPPSLRLCREDTPTNAKVLFEHVGSDTSTDAHTEASTCSECGAKTPESFDEYCFDEASSEASPASTGWLEEVCTQSLWFVPPPPVRQTALSPKSPSWKPRLNAKAEAFQPVGVIEEPAKQPYKHRFIEVINWAKKAVLDSKLVANVQVSDDASGFSLIVQPKATAEAACQVEKLIKVVKDALLQAASKSKCIYLLGYCSPKSFVEGPQGFEATLGAMENATSACWHVFKKGFCRHGANCCKSHPACQVPVRVLVESSQLNSSPCVAQAFQQEMAKLAMAVTATLAGCTYSDKVEAFDKGYQGWTIEVMPTEELKHEKDCLVTLAQNALLTATSSSKTIYIMGHAIKPFMTKSQGFVAMIGDMQDETTACWELYSKGACPKGCACSWEHPNCLMPINVVVKERSSLRCSAAMLDYLAGNGLLSGARK